MGFIDAGLLQFCDLALTREITEEVDIMRERQRQRQRQREKEGEREILNKKNN